MHKNDDYDSSLIYWPIQHRRIAEEFTKRQEKITHYENKLFLDCTIQLNNDFICLIDGKVVHKLYNAINSYVFGIDDASIIFLAGAVEEELTRIYMIFNPKVDVSKCRRAVILKWVTSQNGIMFSNRDIKLIESLIDARDYLAHATRLLTKNTGERIEAGRLSMILPMRTKYTEMVDNFNRAIQKDCERNGMSFVPAKSNPMYNIGTGECAYNCIKGVVPMIIKTSWNFPSKWVINQISSLDDEDIRNKKVRKVLKASNKIYPDLTSRH